MSAEQDPVSGAESQALLASEFTAHVERVAAGLGGEGPTGERPAAGDRAADSEPCVAVIVRDLEVGDFVAGTLEFAQRIPTELRDPWYRTFTRTIFLAGNPTTLGERFRCAHVSARGEIGWIGPEPRASLEGLSLLLRLFRGPAAPPPEPADPVIFGGGSADDGEDATLMVATAGLSTERYLVHVSHLLCEAVLHGALSPGDSLRLRHTDEIDPAAVAPAHERRTELRIAADEQHPERLRLYACLALRAAVGAVPDARP